MATMMGGATGVLSCLGVASLVASQGACSGGTEPVGETSEMTELAAICAVARGRTLLFGGHGAYNDLFGLRARIVRFDRGAKRAAVVHDGEGNVIDASCPGGGTIAALVRRVRPGTPDVVRDYWLLVSRDDGDTWRRSELPPQDSLAYVELLDARRGWVLGYGGAFATNDGGVSWSAVPDPPDAELVKNLLGWPRGGGAVTFQEGRLELRDGRLAIRRSRELGAGVKVQCIARSGRDRLLAIVKTEDAGRRRAGALEVRLPGLETVREIEGLPEDFVCGNAAGGPRGAAVAGANVDSAGFFGISHSAFALADGASELGRLRTKSEREAVLAFDGPRPIVGQAVLTGAAFRVRVRRSR
ncbi:MAG: hypothetical protein HYY06_20680 [Deltaproteobacteria bacterium]|nr:hypothetical protein [Deltaproteobacteria bacterium]